MQERTTSYVPASDPPSHGGFFVGSRWRPARTGALCAAVFLVAAATGAMRAVPREDVAAVAALRQRLEATEDALNARTGELALARLELSRLEAIHRASGSHGIPADLAAAIHDIAVAEGISPDLAFSLVNVESRFASHAVSSKGAVGLTQVMPTTAFDVDPGVAAADLMDERTNLRLGFRYLHRMIRQYRGDVRLALLAYNRGPATVDSIRRSGGDPANGYARKVLGRRRGE